MCLQRRLDAAQMIFGPRGRYSTDLDFTRRSDISDEDIMEMMLTALSQPYHDLSFASIAKDRYFTDKSLAATPSACTPATSGVSRSSWRSA